MRKGKTRWCDGCVWWVWIYGFVNKRGMCLKGHRPRFYMPRGPMDMEWGFKRRCADFSVPGQGG